MNVESVRHIMFDCAVVGERAKCAAVVKLADGTTERMSGAAALGCLFGFAVAYGSRQLDDDTIAGILRAMPSATEQPLPSWITLPVEGA